MNGMIFETSVDVQNENKERGLLKMRVKTSNVSDEKN